MNKKEFEEKYVINFSSWKRMKTAVAPDELWADIEAYGKQQRIGELEKIFTDVMADKYSLPAHTLDVLIFRAKELR